MKQQLIFRQQMMIQAQDQSGPQPQRDEEKKQ